MAYVIRTLAIIGVIALNSPINGGKQAHEAGEALQAAAGAATRIDARTAMNSISAAREATQIIAGLDPATRNRMLTLAIAAAGAREREAGPAPALR